MVATMAKKEVKSSLKVDSPEHRMISKIAAHRGLSVEKLFKDKDVADFFRHLLIEEMRKEGERLKDRK